ncbi:hypothetical protein AK812_SmicGene2790 [Symbiodinium microadriaticum]|uniref:Uncharacterized protein n=1 Tax=Symbiodinium microadriaticum TaxID=2951 RepID=A0A1Q9F0K3_SYMMI|nr:hypothetical protein AK812_SmicGene2790 [Symbiodinium microadriaticum]
MVAMTAAEQREKAAELLRVLEDAFADTNWLIVRKDGGRLIYLDSSHGMGLGWEKEIVNNVTVLMHVISHGVNLTPEMQILKDMIRSKLKLPKDDSGTESDDGDDGEDEGDVHEDHASR